MDLGDVEAVGAVLMMNDLAVDGKQLCGNMMLSRASLLLRPSVLLMDYNEMWELLFQKWR